jgi:hypothetical protein
MTPSDLHYYRRAGAKWRQRAKVLRAAYQAHPERFPRGVPVPPSLPTAAWINKPTALGAPTDPRTAIVSVDGTLPSSQAVLPAHNNEGGHS